MIRQVVLDMGHGYALDKYDTGFCGGAVFESDIVSILGVGVEEELRGANIPLYVTPSRQKPGATEEARLALVEEQMVESVVISLHCEPEDGFILYADPRSLPLAEALALNMPLPIRREQNPQGLLNYPGVSVRISPLNLLKAKEWHRELTGVGRLIGQVVEEYVKKDNPAIGKLKDILPARAPSPDRWL